MTVRAVSFLPLVKGLASEVSSFGVGLMHSTAFLAQGVLRPPFRITSLIGSLDPGIAITVQGYPANVEEPAATAELRRARIRRRGGELRKEKSLGRQFAQEDFQARP